MAPVRLSLLRTTEIASPAPIPAHNFLGREAQMDGLGQETVERPPGAAPCGPCAISSLPGWATNTPSPGRVFNMPSRSNSVYTRAIVFGLTTNDRESSRTEGSRSSGWSLPRATASRIWLAQLPADRQPAGRVDGELHRHLANCTSNYSTVRERCQEGTSEISRFADCRDGAGGQRAKQTRPAGRTLPGGRYKLGSQRSVSVAGPAPQLFTSMLSIGAF